MGGLVHEERTPMNPCPHENNLADVDVVRLQDNEGVTIGFSADVRIRCLDCGDRYRFLGCAPGLSPTEPRVSIDATEIHLPLSPESGGYEGGGIGFDVKILQ